tara:strand:- start:3620 stop:4213 length:594 start_codon:yes stop_codon:yes gene_type:complete
MLLNKPFILASNSLSRQNLLKKAGLRFTKTNPLCDEEKIKAKLIKKTSYFKLPKALAKEKAMSVSVTKPTSLVVGSDTIIIFENQIINKAKTLQDARKKLKKMAGKKHQIISGASACLGNKQLWSTQQTSTITMRDLNNKQINNYLKKAGKEILPSVGCYQAEKLGPLIIASIKGDFFNVLGFPLFPFLSFLSRIKK